MKLLIYDMEVFKYNTLFGVKILDNGKVSIFQTWNLKEITKFYEENRDCIWLGHNISAYDNNILEAIICGKSEEQIYKVSKNLINSEFKPKCKIHLYYYDLMSKVSPYSLKSTELYDGKNISESEISFDIDRPLTEEEKLMTESYNRDDLEQTYDNFLELQSEFKMRLDILKEFKLPLDDLCISGTKLAGKVLGAYPVENIENMKISPKIYDTLQLKNQDLIDYYLREGFRDKDDKLKIVVGGAEQQIGSGGIHAALPKYHTDRALYFDVSGYYNLIMINYDLLPRTLPPEAKEKYIYMYHEQLRLKKIDPAKRAVYKCILLSVFGAMMNKYTDFYDPQKGLLVTITGQLFAVDLMEKLEGIAKVIQSNTDGIIVEPYDWKDENKVIEIVEEWENRTGFVIKKVHISDVWQRDVNCYCYKTEDGEIHVVGEAVRMYEQWNHPFRGNFFDSKEPIIFAYCIVDYLINHVSPEETVEKYKDNLRMFQFSCKRKSFDYTELQEDDIINNNSKTTRLQGVNRAFPSNNKNIIGMVYKCREKGATKRAKVQNLPDNVFVYDGDIRTKEAIKEIQSKIDYQYYVDRAYEKILTFMKFKVIKELKV